MKQVVVDEIAKEYGNNERVKLLLIIHETNGHSADVNVSGIDNIIRFNNKENLASGGCLVLRRSKSWSKLRGYILK